MRLAALMLTLLVGAAVIVIWEQAGATPPDPRKVPSPTGTAGQPLLVAICYTADGTSVVGVGGPPARRPDDPEAGERGWAGLFDAASGRLVQTLKPLTATPRAVAVHPRAGEVVTASSYLERIGRGAPTMYGEVRVWDAAAKSELQQFPIHSFDIHALAFSLDGRSMATGSWGTGNPNSPMAPSLTQGLTTWDYANRKMLATTEGHFDHTPVPRELESTARPPGPRLVYGVCYSADSKRVFSAGEDGAVKAWAADTLKPLATVCQRDVYAERVAVTPDGKLLLGLFNDGKLIVWDATTYQEIRTVKLPENPLNAARRGKPYPHNSGTEPCGLAVAPDGKSCAVATGFAAATVPLDGDGEPTIIPTTLAGPTCVAYSPDGRYLAVGFMDAVLGEKAKRVGGVEQWDLKAKAPRQLMAAKP